MEIRLIRVSAGPAGLDLERRTTRLAVDGLRADDAPVAYVLQDEDGEHVCQLPGIRDRGRKHPAKPLAPLLLGFEQVPLLRGGYTSPGQLLRSLRALLTHAHRRRERNAYLVTAGAPVFDALWTRARPGAGAEADSGSTPARTLLQLLREEPIPPAVEERFLGTSREARLVRQLALRAARRQDPVLILGDTGTGKEVVARLIHDLSPRRHQAFIAVNCGAIPRELLEPELFGYVPGAHSTATHRKMGLWQMADGGTLFLDEIADLALEHQVKILRALEHGEIRPVGAEKVIRVDARGLAATNRDLYAMVQAGEFREDLYHRLRSFLIRTPALRDHPSDIPLLAERFWTAITGDPVARLAQPVLDELKSYRWPGNARELRTVLSNLFGLFAGEPIGVAHLRAVFEFEGQAGQGNVTGGTDAEILAHRAACVRHLRRVDEVIRACEVALRPVVVQGRADRRALSASREAVGRHLDELDLLAGKRLLFGSEPAHAAVVRFHDGLAALHAALGEDPDRGPAVWSTEVEPALARATSALFEAQQRVLSSGF